MARTGRFGRLPTQAPDLSSQIVSMMEQWTNARDRNILDAWTNGGKFEGKKVKDKDILKHYRKRRDSYDKDDPEWDQWNNETWQMRFRISNEGVMMKYRMGNLGPQAVAAHYRQWARKMPKNSSYYRNLMQSAGQFAKAVGAGRAAASKAYDYDALMRRVNSKGKPIQAAADTFEVLNNYARNKGFIEGNESVFTVNTFEAADLAGLMAGLERSGDAQWEEFKAAQLEVWPDWNGELSWGHLRKMTNSAISAKKAQIAEYKKAPADYSSVIMGLKNDIKGLKDVKRIKVWVNAMEDYEEAHQDWLEVREGSNDPDSFLDGDSTYTKDLQAVRKSLLDAGMFAEAGDVLMEIQAIAGDTEAVNGTNNEALWQNSNDSTGGTSTQFSDLEQLARGQETMINGQELLRQGLAYKVQLAPDVSEVAASLGEGKPQNWSIRPFDINPETGKPVMPNEGYMSIPRKDSSGAMYVEFIIGTRIVNEDGELLGYRAPVDGFNIFKLRNPQDPLSWFFTTTDLFTPENGATLAYNSSGELVITQDAQFASKYTEERSGLLERNPRTIIERLMGIEGGPPPPGSPKYVEDAWAESQRVAEDAIEAAEDASAVGANVRDLPRELAGLSAETDAEASQMLETVMNDFFGGIGDKELREATARGYIRASWDEAAEGRPLPTNFKYNEQDAQYLHPDGKPTNRESAFDAASRIADNDNVDIYDGGQPDDFVPGVVPTDTTGTGAGDTIAGALPPQDIGPAGTVQPETGFAPVEDQMGSLEVSNKLSVQWALISDDESQAWAAAALAFLDTNNFEGFSDGEVAALMSVIRLDPATNDFVFANAGAELDSVRSLVGEKAARKAMLLIDSQGELDPIIAGAQLGELQFEDDNRIGAFETHAAEERAATQTPYGTALPTERDRFIHPVDPTKADPFMPKPSEFQYGATNGGVDPTPPPASLAPATVPDPVSVNKGVKPVSLKLPTFANTTTPAAFGAPPKAIKTPAPTAFAPKPDVSTDSSGTTTPWGNAWGGGYR